MNDPKGIENRLLVLSLSELSDLIPDILFAEAWAKAAREVIEEALQSGATVPGASLEPKRATRKWDVEPPLVLQKLQDLLQELGKSSDPDTVNPRKLVSPAEAEKLTGKPAFKNHLSGYVAAESSGFNLKLQNIQRI